MNSLPSTIMVSMRTDDASFWRTLMVRASTVAALVSVAVVLAACGGATPRPTFRSLDQFNAYVDSLPKGGTIDLTDAAFSALVRKAARLDDATFATCVMEPLQTAFLEDETFLLMLPDTSGVLSACSDTAVRRYYWRMSEQQRITWMQTDVQVRERFIQTVAFYRDLWQNDSSIAVGYHGMSAAAELGYRTVSAARLSLSGGLVYSVNLVR